jgi:polyisoprenoid-binding protein YceI/rhodanese-related sulfurtransferase
VLIDVRLAEDFACGHLPGALNQCVYEVAFLPALKSRGISPGATICVYGAAEDSFESRMAAGKLERAGYTHVLEFRGGWEAWLRERRPTDQPRAETPVSSRIKDGVHALDLDESKAVWIGRNLLNKHWGHVAIASGEVEIKNGIPLRGEATLDMRRITCSDLAGNELHDVLIHHLESDDFFDTERFPEARFTFDRVERCADKPGCRNLGLLGNLTLRGVTRPLSIDAVAGVTGEGRAALQSTFAINRTEWGVLYGSGSYFRRLAGHLVNDEIELQLRIVTA